MVGSNYDSQLGLGIQDISISDPRRVPNFMDGGDRIITLYCGHNNTVILTKNGQLWTCGDNMNGRLG
jgi:alpha-tubulin suppressor-like RCC1 family protein